MATEPRTKHMLVDPTTSPIIPEFVLAPRLTDLENRVVGLIDDSKENAKEILEITVDVLKEKFGVKQVEYHRKPSASKPADPEIIREMASKCDYVLVAIGS